MNTFDDQRLKTVSIEKPLVSIIITNYNYARYLTPCLASVATQGYEHWECIIVDDVSTDNSMAVVEAFLEKSPQRDRFTILRRDKNGGQMEAFRDGLDRAKGVFCMTLDADDVLLDDFLETHVRAHLARKAVSFTSSNQYQINEHGKVIAGDHPDHLSKGKLRYVTECCLHNGFWIWATASSMVFRTATLRMIMPEPSVTFRICADYYIAQFANLLGNSILIPGIHGCYRRHGENNFGSNPVVGAVNSVGCLDQHPPHDEFRWVMIRHIMNNYGQFYRIYMEKGVAHLFCRLMRFKELMQFVEEHPDVLKRKKLWYAKLYVGYHLPRRNRNRLPWKKRLVTIAPEFFYEGLGDNPFP